MTHQPGVYAPLRALFLVYYRYSKNKGADQLSAYQAVDMCFCFAYA